MTWTRGESSVEGSTRVSYWSCGSKSQGKNALVTFLLKALQQNAILNAAS